MFIVLTNATPAHKGKLVSINSDCIVTVNSDEITRTEDSEPENVTFVFCPPHGTWEVSETLEEVVSKLNGKTLKSTK